MQVKGSVQGLSGDSPGLGAQADAVHTPDKQPATHAVFLMKPISMSALPEGVQMNAIQYRTVQICVFK